MFSNSDYTHQYYHIINSSFKNSNVELYAFGKFSNSVLQFRSNMFIESRISAQNSYVYLEGKNNNFVDNFVFVNGGAIYLVRNCVLVLTSNFEVTFINNTAINVY